MPRVHRTQQESEELLITEFLDHLGYTISKPNWSDRPDALLTLSKGSFKKRVAVEHTDYFNDTVAGKRSPLTPYYDFWKLVQASLSSRINSNVRPHLSGVSGKVRFKENPPKPKDPTKLAKQLAKELVCFVEDHPVGRSQRLTLYTP